MARGGEGRGGNPRVRDDVPQMTLSVLTQNVAVVREMLSRSSTPEHHSSWSFCSVVLICQLRTWPSSYWASLWTGMASPG